MSDMNSKKFCIRTQSSCMGRDKVSGNLEPLCCHEEISEEKELVLSVIDAIEDCSLQEEHLVRVSNKLSFAADVINKNNQSELMEILPVIKRFSILIYEYREKILKDQTISNLTCSFAQVVKAWFSSYFFKECTTFLPNNQRESLLADITTVEMALGICMVPTEDTLLDDLFF